MSKTVNGAFDKFMKNSVNLTPTSSQGARASRDWLVDRIIKLQHTVSGFPLLAVEHNMYFGSFARKTKIRPLDDVDLIICLDAQHSVYIEGSSHIELVCKDNSELERYCNAGTKRIDSIKILNKVKSSLNEIEQYKNTDIRRNQEAVRLELSSYKWNFDIVPCFLTTVDYLGKSFYLIPDGNGNWKKTDPRVDKDRIARVNKLHKTGILRKVIRLVKYWTKHKQLSFLSSYLIECIILEYYESVDKATEWVECEFAIILKHISSAIHNQILDPKNIQGDLNFLSHEQRRKVSLQSKSDSLSALENIRDEKRIGCRSSIERWRGIFGGDFPSYG